jgi:hypothetical protein
LYLAKPVWASRTEKLVRPVLIGLEAKGDQFGFCAPDEARFRSFCRGVDVWHGESGGGQIARRSAPCVQYDGGRSRSFEMERKNGPRSSFCGFRYPLARQGWFPSGGYT